MKHKIKCRGVVKNKRTLAVISLDAELAEKLIEIAAEQNVSISLVRDIAYREFVREYLANGILPGLP